LAIIRSQISDFVADAKLQHCYIYSLRW